MQHKNELMLQRLMVGYVGYQMIKVKQMILG